MTADLRTASLSQVRLARGLTLEDAERSTHISRRYLIALEAHDYSVFPAPVYARGFLRTYCRYLGIDPEEQLAELPAGWAASTPSTHLPPVSRGPMTFNMTWLVAGILVAAVVGLAIFLSRTGDDLAALQAQDQGQQQAAAQQQDAPAQQGFTLPGSDAAAPAPTEQAQGAGRPLDAGLPGTLPDFQEVAVEDVTAFLDQLDITYLRIDAISPTPAGLIIGQSPEPGVSTDGLGQVTLTVSAGESASGEIRTDCSVLEASTQRTAEEQAYFEDNCTAPDPAIADRTDCEEIRGTAYRSPAERTFFLANCTTQ